MSTQQAKIGSDLVQGALDPFQFCFNEYVLGHYISLDCFDE